MIDVKDIKKQFPIFKNIPNLVYLDSPASSLKPKQVIDKEIEYYQHYGVNIFRGIYPISEKGTFEFEETRLIVSKFINANLPEEIIFLKN